MAFIRVSFVVTLVTVNGTRRVTVRIRDKSKSVCVNIRIGDIQKDFAWGLIRIGDSPVYINVP